MSAQLKTKIGKEPAVVLPLAEYERPREDLEILRSKTLRKKIATVRKEKNYRETRFLYLKHQPTSVR